MMLSAVVLSSAHRFVKATGRGLGRRIIAGVNALLRGSAAASA